MFSASNLSMSVGKMFIDVSENVLLVSSCLTDWEHGPPPKIIVSDFNFFSKLGKIGLKKMLGGVGFPHWTFFSPGASFSQWTFQ